MSNLLYNLSKNDIYPEILAPAGNMEALKAAVKAGADAVFLAGSFFGARAFAANFSDEEIVSAISYAHRYGVKIYVTVNTLVKNSEIEHLREFLDLIYMNGADAVLVQDMGILSILRDDYPGMSIHASTQMNICSIYGAKGVKEMGISRVVAPREMTLPEIRDIKKNADIELEVFVHGAMCYSYSGRCLYSSMEGGRSGNRGRCAQPCRMLSGGAYNMSMRDMCTLEYVPELVDAGVDSFKIEGRMKNEYYVASAVEAYRIMRDDHLAGHFSMDKAKKYHKRLADIFNRGGFSGGYIGYDLTRKVPRKEYLIDNSKPGRRGVTLGTVNKVADGKIHFKALEDIYKGDDIIIDLDDPIMITSGIDIARGSNASLKAPNTKRIKNGTFIYRNRCPKLLEELEDSILNKDMRLPVEVHFTLKTEEAVVVRATGPDGDTVTVCGDIAKPATSKPITDDTIREKMGKLGGTDYYLHNIVIDNDNKSFIPVSSINDLKRQMVEELGKAVDEKSYRARPEKELDDTESLSLDADTVNNLCNDGDGSGECNFSVISTREQLGAAISYSNVLIIEKSLMDEIGNSEGYCIVEGRPDVHIDKAYVLLALPFINRGRIPATKDDVRTYKGFYVRCMDDFLYICDMMRGVGNGAQEGDLGAVWKDKTIILAASLYAYNNKAADFYYEYIKSMAGESVPHVIYEASYELTLRELEGLSYPEGTGVIYKSYGRIPMMLTDALESDLCYNTILSKEPVMFTFDDDRNTILHFTTENAEKVREVCEYLLGSVQQPPKGSEAYSKGHYIKGID